MSELPTTELKSQILEKAPSASLGQGSSPSNTQARLQAALWMLCNILIKVSEVLSKARTESNLASIKAGFSSADETAKAGLLQVGGGAILAGTGVVQGVAGCKKATEFAKAKEGRDNKMKEIQSIEDQEKALPAESICPSTGEIEDSDITVQVEALEDKPILEETEEEIFYDAQKEVQSCKQTEPEEQTEEAQMVEKENTQGKMTSKEEIDKKISQLNREYEVNKDTIEAQSGKIQALALIGQALYHMSQGLGDIKRSEAQKDTIEQQTREGTQSQQEKTTDGLNKEIDRLKDFDAFRSNSSSKG